MTRTRARRLLTVCCLATALPVVACAGEVPPESREVKNATAQPVVSDLVPRNPLVWIGATREGVDPKQLGSADVSVGLASSEGGELEPTKGPEGQPAFSFPPYRGAGRYPNAVIVVRNTTPEDQLSPLDRNFSYGATFRMDEKSLGRLSDNGNNLVQRGLYSDPVQFKLEADVDQRPGCTVRANGREARIVAVERVEPGTWYHVACQKRPGALTVVLMTFEDGSWSPPTGRVDDTDVGALDFPNPATPVSVGGKVDDDGAVVTSEADQFNGDIADAFLAITD